MKLSKALRWLVSILLIFFMTKSHGNEVLQGIDPDHLDYSIHAVELNGDTLALNEMDESAWQELGADGNSFGFRDTRFLFRVRLNNLQSSPQSLFLEIAYPLLDSIDVYTNNMDATSLVYRLGDSLPFHERPFPHRNFVLPYTLPESAQTTFYFSIRTSSATQFPLRVWKPPVFYANEINMSLWYGAYFGVMLVMALYNLFIFIAVRNIEYFWYVCYVLAIVGVQATIDGLSFQYLWPHAVTWNSFNVSFLVGALLIGTLTFQEAFLELRQRSPRLYQVNRFALYIAIGLTLSSFVLPYQLTIRVGTVLTTGACLLALVAGYSVWYRGYTQARYYCLAWTVLLVGGFFTVMNMVGVLPRTSFTIYATAVGALIEVVLLSFALAERINLERRLRYGAQENALASERELRLMREEALQHQQQTNEELEARVHQRTHELEVLNTRLLELSATDQLTGLKNRRFLDQVLDDEVIRCRRYQRNLGVLMIDIDHFKRFNDTWGHLAGDACLRAVATCIRAGLRSPSDRLARYGGEEFCVVLPETAHEGTNTVAERIRSMVEELEFRWEDQVIHVTISVGACVRVPQDADTREKMIAWADEALYHAKQSGRNRVCVADDAIAPVPEALQEAASSESGNRG